MHHASFINVKIAFQPFTYFAQKGSQLSYAKTLYKLPPFLIPSSFLLEISLPNIYWSPPFLSFLNLQHLHTDYLLFWVLNMGNCFVLCKPASRIHSCSGAVLCKDRGVVQIMKMDGKIVEFAAPILVKNALVQFSGLNVGLSREASQYLPSDYELKLGNMFHFLPNSSSACAVQNLGLAEGETPATRIEKEQGGSVKRIKVVITRQQLQDLLAKQLLIEDVLGGETCSYSGNARLESIPEGNEL